MKSPLSKVIGNVFKLRTLFILVVVALETAYLLLWEGQRSAAFGALFIANLGVGTLLAHLIFFRPQKLNKYGIRPYTHFDGLRDALSLREFEPQSWRDWLLIPVSLLRWLFAWAWTQLWAIGRIIRHRESDRWYWMWGRRESPEPIICSRCLWAGARRWCVHTYSGEESEAVDECPRCGGEL